MPPVAEFMRDGAIKTFASLKEHPNPLISFMGKDYDEGTEPKDKQHKVMLRIDQILKMRFNFLDACRSCWVRVRN